MLIGTRSKIVATQDKVAFITGANKGIGLETARGLGRSGIAVVLASRDESNGRSAAEELKSEGIKNVEAIRFDVTRPEDHQAIVRFLDERYGKLDILVNNAGVSLEDADFGAPDGFNTTPTVTADILRRTFETNFFAVVGLTQALLPLIRKASAGRIVNLSSVLGSLTLHSDPSSGIYDKKSFAYDASKTALNAFTVHLAQALRGTPIKVNSAHPGWVKTDMGGQAAPLEVSEGGKTSVQLATLPDDGPTGGYFHLGQPLPW
jgi:NAD(P)-dependent dehydrogenase (short-subunit alcohol dehydrogenase family)